MTVVQIWFIIDGEKAVKYPSISDSILLLRTPWMRGRDCAQRVPVCIFFQTVCKTEKMHQIDGLSPSAALYSSQSPIIHVH